MAPQPLEDGVSLECFGCAQDCVFQESVFGVKLQIAACLLAGKLIIWSVWVSGRLVLRQELEEKGTMLWTTLLLVYKNRYWGER